ncbi:MAG: MFS transporter [Proteobacteria bacterium]|nr:MFS transporter [Pseudomonadota bacterium]
MASQPLSYRMVLGLPGLRLLLAAMLLSRLASRMLTLAIVLYALDRFQSPVIAGWLSFAAVAPGLLVGPVAGAVLDRVGPVRGIAADMAAAAVLLLALAGLDGSGWSNPLATGLIAVLLSLTSPLGAVGVRALLPRLVPADGIDRANGLDTAIWALVDATGPGLAGLIAGFVGVAPALVMIGGIYGLAGLTVSRVRYPAAVAPARIRLLSHAAQGIRLVVFGPTLRGLAVSYSFYLAAWGILVVAIPVQAVQSFPPGSAEATAGLLWTGAGVAGGLSALLAGHLRTAGRERTVLVVAMALSAPAIWPLCAESGVAGLVAGLMLCGLLAGPVDVAVLTLRLRRTPMRDLERVLAVSMSVNQAGFPLGMALAGPLLTWSAPAAFAVAAGALVLAAISARVLIPACDERS